MHLKKGSTRKQGRPRQRLVGGPGVGQGSEWAEQWCSLVEVGGSPQVVMDSVVSWIWGLEMKKAI